MEEMHGGKVCGKVREDTLPSLGTLPSQHQSRGSLNPII